MAQVFINSLRSFLHIYKLKTKCGLIGLRRLREMVLKTISNITGSVAAKYEMKNGLRESTCKIVNEELVMLIPKGMCRVRLDESSGGGGGICIGGGSCSSNRRSGMSTINKFS